MKCSRCGAVFTDTENICSTCGEQISSVLKENSIKRSYEVFYYAFGVFFFALIFYILINYLPGGENKVISKQPDVLLPSAFEGEKIAPFLLDNTDIEIKNGNVMFDFFKLKDKKFVEFFYKSDVSNIKLITFITPSGKMVTSIGLCEPCGQENFKIEERDLVSSCGTKWYLDNLEFSGGCSVCKKFPPDPIPSSINGNNKIVIDENIIQNWKRRAF